MALLKDCNYPSLRVAGLMVKSFNSVRHLFKGDNIIVTTVEEHFTKPVSTWQAPYLKKARPKFFLRIIMMSHFDFVDKVLITKLI